MEPIATAAAPSATRSLVAPASRGAEGGISAPTTTAVGPQARHGAETEGKMAKAPTTTTTTVAPQQQQPVVFRSLLSDMTTKRSFVGKDAATASFAPSLPGATASFSAVGDIPQRQLIAAASMPTPLSSTSNNQVVSSARRKSVVAPYPSDWGDIHELQRDEDVRPTAVTKRPCDDADGAAFDAAMSALIGIPEILVGDVTHRNDRPKAVAVSALRAEAMRITQSASLAFPDPAALAEEAQRRHAEMGAPGGASTAGGGGGSKGLSKRCVVITCIVVWLVLLAAGGVTAYLFISGTVVWTTGRGPAFVSWR